MESGPPVPSHAPEAGDGDIGGEKERHDGDPAAPPDSGRQPSAQIHRPHPETDRPEREDGREDRLREGEDRGQHDEDRPEAPQPAAGAGRDVGQPRVLRPIPGGGHQQSGDQPHHDGQQRGGDPETPELLTRVATHDEEGEVAADDGEVRLDQPPDQRDPGPREERTERDGEEGVVPGPDQVLADPSAGAGPPADDRCLRGGRRGAGVGRHQVPTYWSRRFRTLTSAEMTSENMR